MVAALVALPLADPAARQRRPDASVEDLVSWMTGAFTTDAQADEDERSGKPVHERVRIVTAPVRFATGALPGQYLYVERAPLNRLHRPTSQLVFRIAPSGRNIVVEPWAIENERAFLAAHSSAELRAAITMSALKRLEGCDIELSLDGAAFRGSTRPGRCRALAGGADHAAIDWTISRDGWIVAERAFDKDGRQTWGTPDGDLQQYRRQVPLDASRK